MENSKKELVKQELEKTKKNLEKTEKEQKELEKTKKEQEQKEKVLRAILIEEKKEELKKNSIIIDNNRFSLNPTQKAKLEKSLGGKFKKLYFTEKNAFLFYSVKEEMEKLGYSFLTTEELEEKSKNIELEEETEDETL